MERVEGFHVAIIMDGNGRWARKRFLPRTEGHRAGVKAVRAAVVGCKKWGVRVLTLYAFSSDNWKRPKAEVGALMRLLRQYLDNDVETCLEKGIRLNVIGRRDRLAPELVMAIQRAEAATAQCTNYVLRLAVDYSAKYAIHKASSLGPADDEDTFARHIQQVHHASVLVPPIDLLIRTGGEHRLSDFMLWEAAYAELHFCKKFWPDFREKDFGKAVEDFRGRERRYGEVVDSGVSA